MWTEDIPEGAEACYHCVYLFSPHLSTNTNMGSMMSCHQEMLIVSWMKSNNFSPVAVAGAELRNSMDRGLIGEPCWWERFLVDGILGTVMKFSYAGTKDL
jgi:hypothetical protein